MVRPPNAIRRVRSWFLTKSSRRRRDSSVTDGDDVSSTQREGSGSTEDLNLQQWSSLESSVDSSCFSGEISDAVSTEQQRKEELAAMAPPSEGSMISEGSCRTAERIRDMRRDPPVSPRAGSWPNSNATRLIDVEEGCSRAPLANQDVPDSPDTQGLLRDLTYVGGMSYDRTRAPDLTRPCAYGKHRRVRPPLLKVANVATEVGAGDLPRARSVATSAASSGRSSIFKAAVQEARAETQRAIEGLAATRAECNEQHQAVMRAVAAVQRTVQEGLQTSDQLRSDQRLQTVDWVR